MSAANDYFDFASAQAMSGILDNLTDPKDITLASGSLPTPSLGYKVVIWNNAGYAAAYLDPSREVARLIAVPSSGVYRLQRDDPKHHSGSPRIDHTWLASDVAELYATLAP